MKTLRLMKTDLGYEGYEPEDMIILHELTGIACPVLIGKAGLAMWKEEAEKAGYVVEVHV